VALQYVKFVPCERGGVDKKVSAVVKSRWALRYPAPDVLLKALAALSSSCFILHVNK